MYVLKVSGKKASIGSSATSFDVKYGKMLYVVFVCFLFMMIFFFVNVVRVFINVFIVVLIVEICSRFIWFWIVVCFSDIF